MSDTLYTVETGSSAQVVAKMLRVLFPDAATVLDATHSKGKFWGTETAHLRVIGTDLDPAGAKDARADFTRLPFLSGSVDVVVVDPPFLWDEGKTNRSIMGKRFSTYRSEQHAIETVQNGAREAWRVARIGVIVKCQDFCHASKKVWMSQWLREAIPVELYDAVHLVGRSKVIDPKWTGSQLTAWSNSTSFLTWRKGDQRHIRRRRPAALKVAS